MREWGVCRGTRYDVVGRRVKGLKARVGRERCVGREGDMDQNEQWRFKAGGVRRRRHSDARCVTSRRSRDAAGVDSSRSESYIEF